MRRRRPSAGGTPTAPRWCGCRCTRRASRRRAGWRSARLDSACNPYLAYAVILGAGLTGVQKGYELPPPTEDDVWSLTETERRAMGYESLPQNLTEALVGDGALRAGGGDPRRARVRLLPAQQARGVGRATAATSPRTSWRRTCRSCRRRAPSRDHGRGSRAVVARHQQGVLGGLLPRPRCARPTATRCGRCSASSETGASTRRRRRRAGSLRRDETAGQSRNVRSRLRPRSHPPTPDPASTSTPAAGPTSAAAIR